MSHVATPGERLFRTLAAHTPVGIFVSNATGGCEYVNPRWCELAGLTVEQALGDGWVVALHPDDADRVRAEWAEAAAEGRDSVVEYRFRRPDGSAAWIEGFAAAVRDETGAVVAWVGSCLDVTQRKAAEDELRRLAELDWLTGCLNRRRFHEQLRERLERGEDEPEPAALLLLDIDRFKLVNDSLGHLAGDDVLRAVAATIRRHLRAGDAVSRLGGDEFAAIVAEPDPGDAQRVARRVAAAIRAESIPTRAGPTRVTVSIGIVPLAGYTRGMEDEALSAADAAMYRAKDRGRDGVALAGRPAAEDTGHRLPVIEASAG